MFVSTTDRLPYAARQSWLGRARESGWDGCMEIVSLVAFLGPSGSGKSTQAALLERRGLRVVSAGQLLREAARESAQIAATMSAGEKVDPAFVTRLVTAEIAAREQDQRPVVVDGYPRSMEEANLLPAYLPREARLAALVVFEVSSVVVRRRLELRGREDDTSLAIDTRLAYHEANRAALVESLLDLRPTPRVMRLTGDQSRAEVHEQIVGFLSASGVSVDWTKGH